MRAWSWGAAAWLLLGLATGAGPALAQAPREMPMPTMGASEIIVTFEDALLAFRPSEDGQLRRQPRDSLPEETYFRWSGRITAMVDSEGPHTERLDPFRGSKRLQGWRFIVFLCLDPPAPFAFRDIRRAFVELDTGVDVEVMGRYVGAIQVEQPNSEVLTLPMLDNCYVR